EEVVTLLGVLQEQHRDLSSRPDIRGVLMFENKGDVVGVSNPHPHCQIYGTNFLFRTLEVEAAAASDHWTEHRRSLLTDVIAAEETGGRRVLIPRGQALSFVPSFARYPYETYIAPREPHAHLADVSRVELDDLADVLRETLIRFDNLWRMSFPYVMVLHQL